MSNITLPIETTVIGTEPTNTVNARDLHANLEVRKKFADWIRGQINSLGLEENSDYLTIPLKGNGGKFVNIEYALTLDTAKHIAMASRTPRGKEIRNYFIEAEKKLTQIGEAYRAQNQTIESTIFSMMAQQNDKIIGLIGNMTTMMSEMIGTQKLIRQSQITQQIMTDRIDDNMEQIRHEIIDVKTMVASRALSKEDRKKLYDHVMHNARDIAEDYGIESGVIAGAIFSKLKQKYGIDHYADLPPEKLGEAILYVNDVDVSK